MTGEDSYRIERSPEAYSRVTNPERFRPLHARALALVERLQNGYQVTKSEVFDLVPGLVHPFEHARPPVTLTPETPEAASIAIGFTVFPSLLVRCGRWFGTSFPICACDACAATIEDEVARLEELLADVVAGHFREELDVPLFGDVRLRWWLGDATAGDGYHEEGMSTLPRSLARRLRGRGLSRVEWQPWPLRRAM